MKPLMRPSACCRVRKYFCERAAISTMKAKPTREARMALSANSALVASIITSAPISSVTEDTSVPAPLPSTCAMASTSLVRQDRMSPKLVLSKYRRGIRLIFWAVSLRSRWDSRWVTVVRIYCCP